MAKLLTKSRFKLAIECPTKLYYANNSDSYFDRNNENDFLKALADGGHQIGELAKFKYFDESVKKNITISTLNQVEALQATADFLKSSGKVIIAEAAFQFENLFARVDLFIRDEQQKRIEIIEVKSKSIDQKAIDQGFRNIRNKEFQAKWLPYLYDITFQYYLVSKVAETQFPGYTIVPKLLLINAEKEVDVDGLHQHFPIHYAYDPVTNRTRTLIQTSESLTRDQLGSLDVLREIDVSKQVNDLLVSMMTSPHFSTEHATDFKSFVGFVSKLQSSGEKYFFGISKTCKSCQYRADASEKKKSGVHECWSKHFNQSFEPDIPLSIDIWGGKAGNSSVAQNVINQNRALLADIQGSDFADSGNLEDDHGAMSAFGRRMAQIAAFQIVAPNYVISEEGLAEMDNWEWPLHMIDFETSAPAIPFFKGMSPYEPLAFQFSHHIMEKDFNGKVTIRHQSQWISTTANTYPSIEFVRQLNNALMPNGELKGTVFRYHNHENTILRKIRTTISELHENTVTDKDALIQFVDLITKSTGQESKYIGEKAMIDLHALVTKGYYSKHAGGSISLKYILPAILHDAKGLKEIYSQANIYGVNKKIKSLNFDHPNGHIWLDEKSQNNPYKTLPPVFENDANLNSMVLMLAGNDGDGDDQEGTINQGGLAMTAYNFTQFTALSDEERNSIGKALLRYCELDTLAMVMLVQGLMELRNKPLVLAD